MGVTTTQRFLSGIFLFSLSMNSLHSSNICPTPVPDEYKSIQPGNIKVGFFASWDVYTHKYHITDIYPIANQLTHIIYAFAKPDSTTGTCQLHDPWGDIGADYEHQTELAGNFKKLQELKRKFPHIKVLLSVGGGKYAHEFEQLAKKNLLHTFAQSCADILDSYTYRYDNPEHEKQGAIHFEYSGLFDGIDIDWEWSTKVPQGHEKKYAHFLTTLRSMLDKKRKGLLLTADLQVNPNIYKQLPLAHIAKSIDWFHVMAYDFYSPRNDSVGLNAPICSSYSVFSIDGAFNRIMDAGVSPNKMVIALPLYGYKFDNCNGLFTQYKKVDADSRAFSYNSIQKKFVENAAFKKQWNELGKVPVLYNKKDKICVSYDDTDSLKEKVAFAKMKRLKGIALWTLSGDDKHHTLVRKVFDAW